MEEQGVDKPRTAGDSSPPGTGWAGGLPNASGESTAPACCDRCSVRPHSWSCRRPSVSCSGHAPTWLRSLSASQKDLQFKALQRLWAIFGHVFLTIPNWLAPVAVQSLEEKVLVRHSISHQACIISSLSQAASPAAWTLTHAPRVLQAGKALLWVHMQAARHAHQLDTRPQTCTSIFCCCSAAASPARRSCWSQSALSPADVRSSPQA